MAETFIFAEMAGTYLPVAIRPAASSYARRSKFCSPLIIYPHLVSKYMYSTFLNRTSSRIMNV